MSLENTTPVIYVSVLSSDGTFRVQSTEDNPNAIKRDWKSKDGSEGTKYELKFNKLGGYIKGIYFKEGLFHRELRLIIVDGEDKYILSMNTDTNFATDIMKKLPNLTLDEKVSLISFSFKNRKGITIIQDGEKIKDAYCDFDTKTKTRTYLSGFPVVNEKKRPTPEEKTKWSKFWEAYYFEVEEYLVEKTGEIIKTLPEYKEEETVDSVIEELKEEPKLEDAPF